MQAALERAMAELVLGAEIDPGDPEAVASWLDRHQVSAEDRRAIVDNGLAGLAVYRKLIRGTLREALHATIPRSIARLGPVFDEYFDRFLCERGPRTHYLRDVGYEFLAFVRADWHSDPRVESYILDLARHESLQILIGSSPDTPQTEALALELDKPLCFVEGATVERYAFAVHLLSDDEDDRGAPERRETWLFVYRSPEHEVRYLELTPLAGAIMARLLGARETLGQAVRGACESRETPLDQAVLDGTARVLADLAERGALLGAGELAETPVPDA